MDRFNHIIFRRLEFKIETPSINALKRKIHQWLWCGVTGGVILGHSRSGKTTAIEMIKNSFVTRNNEPINSLHLTIPTRDTKRIASLLRALCVASGFKVKIRTVADDLANQMVEHLAELSTSNQYKEVILFIDEVQRLTTSQLHVFAELADKLREMKVTLFVFFIGNSSESNRLLKSLQREENNHIRGRFFTQGHYFKGISSEDDVIYCLRQYDTQCFPDPDSPPHTRFFLKDEFDNGFRLASLGKQIWRYFRNKKNIIGVSEWGAQYFVTTINPLLTDYLPKFEPSLFNEDMFEKCFEVSGIVPLNIEHLGND